MPGRALQIDTFGQLIDQHRFAAAGIAADQHHRQFGTLFQRGQQELTQRLVAANNARIGHSSLT